MKSSFKILLPLFIAVVLNSCSSKIHIDNPGSEAITVSIDGKDLSVAAGETIEADVKDGASAHVIVKNASGTVLKDTTLALSKGGVLNPIGHNYIHLTEVYTEDKDADLPDEVEKSLGEMNMVTVKDKSYFGFMHETFGQFFFAKAEFDYAPNENMPENILLGKNEKYKIKHKLYRQDELHANGDDYLVDDEMKDLLKIISDAGMDLNDLDALDSLDMELEADNEFMDADVDEEEDLDIE